MHFIMRLVDHSFVAFGKRILSGVEFGPLPAVDKGDLHLLLFRNLDWTFVRPNVEVLTELLQLYSLQAILCVDVYSVLKKNRWSFFRRLYSERRLFLSDCRRFR